MNSIPMVTLVNESNFDEAHYLRSNPDVAIAVQNGEFRSGRHHFKKHGSAERRFLRVTQPGFAAYKAAKLERVGPCASR